MIIIKFVVALIWAVVGLFIWIPILFRVIFFYIFNISFLTVMEKKIVESNHITLLVNTWAIYRNGFKNIFMENDGKIIRNQAPTSKRQIWVEILWSIFFWGTIITPFLI